MVFLKRTASGPPRKKRPVPIPPPSSTPNPQSQPSSSLLSVLADCGFTLTPPSLPSPIQPSLSRLHSLLSPDPSHFLSHLSLHLRLPRNLRAFLLPASPCSESLARALLLVPSLQLPLQLLLLEKLPEYFDSTPTPSLEDDIARLIVNQFRWLDFLVDADSFTEKLMEVVSVCPTPLKRDIIGALPEIAGERCNARVVSALEDMLQEDVDVIVPVLDALSSLNLDEELREKAINMALSCIKTIDADHMPHLLRFLMMSATQKNVGRIVSEVREQLQFVSVHGERMTGGRRMKGKLLARSAEASILEALKSSLRFKNILCESILKELKSLNCLQDHKVIDVWLLVLIYTNGGSLQKSAANTIKRKIVEGLFQDYMFDQCIHGQGELVKDNFSTFLSICEFMLASKEKQVRDFGVNVYKALFEEFADRYSRQEVIGALVTHIGSGIIYEVNSALDTMILLASKYSHEMDPFSFHVHGILDYLEGFNDESLRKVYEIFCMLSSHALSSGVAIGSTIANELLMIVRKQVGNPDMKYRKMGIIGTVRIISLIGHANATIKFSSSQNSNSEEAVELLKMSSESCKSSNISLTLLYDELIALVNSVPLQPPILEWMGKLASEFEPAFLADLEGGKLLPGNLSGGLEGELWMNLDGDVSPVCLNILQLLSSTWQRNSCPLVLLPVHFLLLSSVEMSTNQGSLGGIDALLGCPFHLPSLKYFEESMWMALTGEEKKIILLSLYYAINWIRELISVFSTQIGGEVTTISQIAREEISSKLLKRLRNLVYLESLLNSLLKFHAASLPELHVNMKQSGSPLTSKLNDMPCPEKVNGNGASGNTSVNRKRGRKKKLKVSAENGDKLKQPTIIEMLKKAGVVSQELPNEGLRSSSSSMMPPVAERHDVSVARLDTMDICALPLFLEEQRSKFRPLHIDSLFILSYSQGQDSCCMDSAAELPLHLYLLRDFCHKLEFLTSLGQTVQNSTPVKYEPGLNGISSSEFLMKVIPLFPILRKYLNAAVGVLEEGPESCNDHWKSHSALAGNPEITYIMFSKLSSAELVIREFLSCFRKILNSPDIYTSSSCLLILRQLLEAFQPDGEAGGACSKVQPQYTVGNLDYLYNGTFSFLENMMAIACPFSFLLASELLMAQDTVVSSISVFLSKTLGKDGSTSLGLSKELYPSLQKKLAASACKILSYNWFDDEKCWKGKVEIMQKILRIYLNNAESTASLLVHLAHSILPQVFFDRSTNTADGSHDFPSLCPTTFVSWYKVLHEVNIELLSKLVKDLLSKSRHSQLVDVNEMFIQLRCFVDVIVSLVNTCKTLDDKVIVHAMAIKYGGKFVDIFIKVFDFLEVHFRMHEDAIIQMMKKLQKATRILHTLCSEAKGSKRTMVMSKIPAAKRSMECLLFRVKALLYRAADGYKFWLGNLKHKDLLGQAVSSQVYAERGDDCHSPGSSE